MKIKIGIGQQEKISKKVLELIDFIEIKELTLTEKEINLLKWLLTKTKNVKAIN